MRLIDADELKKVLCEKYEAREHYIGEKMLEAIDNAPSVADRTEEVLSLQNTIAKLVESIAENARPQGEWKVYGRQGGIPITDYCTNCKYEMKWYRNKCNYCPNCGAEMRKGGAE